MVWLIFFLFLLFFSHGADFVKKQMLSNIIYATAMPAHLPLLFPCSHPVLGGVPLWA